MNQHPMTIHERMNAILEGRTPDCIPFIDRLEAWHTAHIRNNSLPPQYEGMGLTDIHRAVGMGQQRFVVPYGLKLHGVEVITHFEGEEIFHAHAPVIREFPGMWDLVPNDRPGVTETTLITTAGRLHITHALHEMGVASGTTPYLKSHLIKEEADYAVAETIIERAEFVPLYDDLRVEQQRVGDAGMVVPLIHRIPFQQVLLEYLGESRTYYEMHDTPQRVTRLLEVLDAQMSEILWQLADLPVAYIEFPDNLHGQMTSPRLFAAHCLPHYQRYTEIVHGYGKKVGSHTDGEIRPLFGLLTESGLDVCESVAPAPLTSATFAEIWEGLKGGPLIWGGIPSPLLEPRTPEQTCKDYIENVLALVRTAPIVLGVSDMVMAHNAIERVCAIAQRIEEHPLD